MEFITENCTLSELKPEVLSQTQPFSCGDEDIDDFFLNNAELYERQLLGRSYCYRLDSDMSIVVCAFTLSNSSMDVRHLPGSRKKKVIAEIPREKHLSSYPAMLIGRLGVNSDFGKKGIGSELLELIKTIALNQSNWGACRFLTVDAYNSEATRRFYERNGFIYLFTSEQQEKSYIGMSDDKLLRTRLMYFDLLRGF